MCCIWSRFKAIYLRNTMCFLQFCSVSKDFYSGCIITPKIQNLENWLMIGFTKFLRRWYTGTNASSVIQFSLQVAYNSSYFELSFGNQDYHLYFYCKSLPYYRIIMLDDLYVLQLRVISSVNWLSAIWSNLQWDKPTHEEKCVKENIFGIFRW